MKKAKKSRKIAKKTKAKKTKKMAQKTAYTVLPNSVRSPKKTEGYMKVGANGKVEVYDASGLKIAEQG